MTGHEVAKVITDCARTISRIHHIGKNRHPELAVDMSSTAQGGSPNAAINSLPLAETRSSQGFMDYVSESYALETGLQ